MLPSSSIEFTVEIPDNTAVRAMAMAPAIGWLWLTSLALLGLFGADVRRHHFEAAGLGFGVGLFIFAVGHRSHRTNVAESTRTRPMVRLIPATVALLAFAWSIDLGPLSDDFVLRRWTDAGEWLPEGWGYARPLPLAVWQSIVAAGGDWTALHAVNVVLHAINTALVASLATALGGAAAGLAAALVFAVFPASTEPVAWASGVFDVLSTTFALLAAMIWVRFAPSACSIGALVLVSVGGFLSKESGVVTPALIMLIAAFTPTASRDLRARTGALTAVVAAVIVLVIVRALASPAVASHLENFPATRRQWKNLIVRTFAAIAIPMRTESGITTQAYVVGLLVLILVGVALVHAATASKATPSPAPRSPLLVVGAGWLLLSSLPLLRVYVAPTMDGSRYLYLPAVGFALAIGGAFVSASLRAWTLIAAAALSTLLGLYVTRIAEERRIWLQAAALRDEVLDDASRVVSEMPCRTLSIVDAPDNVRGAFVFRHGLSDALGKLPKSPAGQTCVFRWTGSALVRAPDSPASAPG